MASPELHHNGWSVALAFLIYFFAHFTRSLKYWLILNDSRVSLKGCFLIFYGTAVVAFFVPVVLIEIARLLLFSSLTLKPLRTSVCYVLFRLLDAFFLGMSCLYLASWTPKPSKIANSGWVLVILSLSLAIALVTSSRTLVPIQELLLRRFPSQIGVSLMRFTSSLARISRDILSVRERTLVLPFLMTIVIWLFDVLALQTLLPSQPFLVLASEWIRFSLRGLFTPGPVRMALILGVLGNDIGELMFYPQAVFAFLLAAFWVGAKVIHKTSFRKASLVR